ncbi:M23 family metallopeptidase [Patescibacteria group bacterium]|nr:M23 family metallopeptidase [Patescibacteria group bacterium]
MRVLYQKLSTISLILGTIFCIMLFVNVSNVHAASCASYTGNAPQHMAVSCNGNLLTGKIVLNNIAKNKLSASGIGTVNVSIPNIPLFKYFDSVSSLGVKSNPTNFGIPYQTYGYLMEKLNYNPNINYNVSSNLNGVGALNIPYSCGASNGVTCSVMSINGNGNYGYFSVPYIGKAADLFTLGNIFSLSSPYKINTISLPNNSIITSTPNSLIGKCSGSSNGCVSGKKPLDYKLTTGYGNPYTLQGATINKQISILGTIGTFFSNLWGSVTSVLTGLASAIGLGSNPPPPPLTKNFPLSSSSGFCPQYISQLNNTAPISNTGQNACTQGSPAFQVQASFSCVPQYNTYIKDQKIMNTDQQSVNQETVVVNGLVNRVNTLTQYMNSPNTSFQSALGTGLELNSLQTQLSAAENTLNTDNSALSVAIANLNIANTNLHNCLSTLQTYETSGAPFSFQSDLYLQGINRILADFWYMEAIMNGGPPIGHTNTHSWKNDVNSKTFFLKKNINRTNLYKGIGISVPVNITIKTYSAENAASITTGATSATYYFPWLGDAIQIAQNLATHHFQPYYANNTTSSSPTYPTLAPGEYYIKDPSKHPDPLLLYLICTGSLSPNDPVVRNALGSYSVSKFFSSGACNGSPSVSTTSVPAGGTPTSNGSYNNPLRKISKLNPERIDQGVDYSGTGPIYALGPGTIVYVHAPSNSGWGPNNIFINEKLSAGSAKGQYVYVAECINPTVSVGQSVTSSTVIGYMTNCGSGIETGWATGPNDLAAAHSVFNGSNSTAFGLNYSELLASLGAPPGNLNLPLLGTLPSNWPNW